MFRKTLIYVGLGAFMAFSADAGELRSLKEFGESGTAVPRIVRESLPAGFFTRHLTSALASGHNYTALFEVPSDLQSAETELGGQLSRREKRLSIESAGIEIHLENRAERDNDVVVSATGFAPGAARNFIVRMAPGESMSLTDAALGTYSTIYFLSMQAFSVEVAVRIDGAGELREAPEVLAPRAAAATDEPLLKTTNYCVNKTQEIEICNEDDECVDAWARRKFWMSDPLGDWYLLYVDYPVKYASFHCPQGGGNHYLPCKMSSYFTHRCDGTPFQHVWTGLDDTIFHCASSTASCMYGCTGTWTVNCR